MTIDDAAAEVVAEVKRAIDLYPAFHTGHEGWAVIKEELDELWEEVRNYPRSDKQRMREEARQIAAMGLRFMVELT